MHFETNLIDRAVEERKEISSLIFSACLDISKNFDMKKRSFLSFLSSGKKIVRIFVFLAIFFGIGSCILWVASPAPFYDIYNDYNIYWQCARILFGSNLPPETIYDGIYLRSLFCNDFRYFPSMLILFYPFSLIDRAVSFAFYTFSSLLLSLYSSYLFREVSISLFPRFAEKINAYAIYIFTVWFWVDYFMVGQISSLVCVILLLSMKKYIEGKDNIASFLLGVSIFVKPVSLIVVFCILMSSPRKFLKRAFFILLPMIPDVILFLFRPTMLESFINASLFYPSLHNSYFSRFNITTMVVVLGAKSSILLVGGFSCAALIALKHLGTIKDAKMKYVFSFCFGIGIYSIIQVDMWGSQLVYIYPFFAMTLLNARNEGRLRFLFYYYPMWGYLCSLAFFTGIHELNTMSIIFMTIVAAITVFAWQGEVMMQSGAVLCDCGQFLQKTVISTGYQRCYRLEERTLEYVCNACNKKAVCKEP